MGRGILSEVSRSTLTSDLAVSLVHQWNVALSWGLYGDFSWQPSAILIGAITFIFEYLEKYLVSSTKWKASGLYHSHIGLDKNWMWPKTLLTQTHVETTVLSVHGWWRWNQPLQNTERNFRANIFPYIPVNPGNIRVLVNFRLFKLAAAPVPMHFGTDCAINTLSILNV